jgi:hypothetical protein
MKNQDKSETGTLQTRLCLSISLTQKTQISFIKLGNNQMNDYQPHKKSTLCGQLSPHVYEKSIFFYKISGFYH